MSSRWYKTFVGDNELLRNEKKCVKTVYDYLKEIAFYKTTDTHIKGSINISERALMRALNLTTREVQFALKRLEEFNLIKRGFVYIKNRMASQDLTHPMQRKKIKKTSFITICNYDNYSESRVSQNPSQDCTYDSVTHQKNGKTRVTALYNINNIDIDRKNININPEYFSKEKHSCPLGKGEGEFESGNGDKDLKILDFERMEPTNENFETSQDFKNFKNEVLEILENLKNENFELKKEISILKNKILESRAKNEIESSLNTEKNEKERKSCGKKKNTAVLSHENSKEDKLHQTGGENATGGLKMANTGISQKFVPPTLQEVEEYCKERRNGVDAEMFVDFYASKGWLVGKTKMKDWKACVRTWERGRNYSKDRASVKNRDDWNGDNELRFKENLKLVTNSTQWRDYSNQTYVDFNRDDKIAYYNEFIIKFANNTKYSEIFYDDELQTKIKEHFLNFLNIKLAKKQEFKEKQKSYLNKPQEKTFMQRAAERMEQAGMFRIFDEAEKETKRLC